MTTVPTSQTSVENTTASLLKEALDKFLESADLAVGFFNDQIPLVIKELLLWEGVHSFLGFIVSLTLTCLLLRLGYTKILALYSEGGYTFKDYGLKKEFNKLPYDVKFKIKDTMAQVTQNLTYYSLKNSTLEAFKRSNQDRIREAYKYFSEDRFDEVLYYSAWVVYIIAGVILINSLLLATTWLKILIAPRLYLLEYAAELVK